MPNELLIPFESLAARGVQKDTKMKTGSSSSFFYNIYLQTYKLIDQICHENKKYSEKNKAKKCDNVGEQDLNCIQNIIAFTGRRGTGKTSAMLSIIDSLTIPCISKEFRTETESKSFICNSYTSFPYIDAAMMAENEDMFEIVLSRMAASVKRQFGTTYDRKYKYYEHQAQIDSVLEKICNVYEHYSSLMGVNSDSSKIVHNFMEIVSNKHNVRNEFIDLVREYTNLFSVVNEKKDCYLVICIDDIDMSLPNHMSIMQCIHQYFMIPKTIVMVSLNFDLLSATLQKDIFSKLQISSSTSSEHETQMHLTRSQTYDFLKKVIPPDMRITMPSWKKRDYVELFPCKISFTNLLDTHGELNLVEIKRVFPNLEDSMLIEKIRLTKGEKALSPKQLIMILLADRTKCYLDIRGYKMHFMQPDSLRSLNDLFYLLYNMENIYPLEDKKGDNSYYAQRESNRKVLLDYLNFKMLQEFNFDPEKLSFIELFLASPIERRGRMVWEYYHKLLSRQDNGDRIRAMYNDGFYTNECNRFKVEDYTFGELFRSLYLSTRLGIFSNDFVKFILASFSFSMPQFLEMERKVDKDPDYGIDIKKSDPRYMSYWYPRTRESFGYSLIGTWCRDLFDNSGICITITKQYFYDAIKRFITNYKSGKENCRDPIRDFIYFFTLCSCSFNDSISVTEQEDGDKKEYIIHIKVDPTAFILNSLRLEKRVERVKFSMNDNTRISMYNLLVLITSEDELANNNLFNDYLSIFRDFSACESSLEDFFYKNYILEVRKELTTSDVLPIFFYKHTDLAYNVIKRSIRYMVYSSDSVVASKQNPIIDFNDQWAIMTNFYKQLVFHLERQDSYYYSEDNKKVVRFTDIVKNNPIVRLFYIEDSKPSFKDYYSAALWIKLENDKSDYHLNTKSSDDHACMVKVTNPIEITIINQDKNDDNV